MHELIPGARVEGEIILDGADIYGDEVDPTWIRSQIGMVFQQPNPFPTMSILRPWWSARRCCLHADGGYSRVLEEDGGPTRPRPARSAPAPADQRAQRSSPSSPRRSTPSSDAGPRSTGAGRTCTPRPTPSPRRSPPPARRPLMLLRLDLDRLAAHQAPPARKDTAVARGPQLGNRKSDPRARSTVCDPSGRAPAPS
jgi:hypothetical protein